MHNGWGEKWDLYTVIKLPYYTSTKKFIYSETSLVVVSCLLKRYAVENCKLSSNVVSSNAVLFERSKTTYINGGQISFFNWFRFQEN